MQRWKFLPARSDGSDAVRCRLVRALQPQRAVPSVRGGDAPEH